MVIAVITIAAIALAAGIGLALAQRRLPPAEGDLVEQVDALLPQTQCAQCGYPGCRPYAEAVVAGEAPLNTLDHPVVEYGAPRALLRSWILDVPIAAENHEMIQRLLNAQ